VKEVTEVREVEERIRDAEAEFPESLINLLTSRLLKNTSSSTAL
jgi:hypothetical protein